MSIIGGMTDIDHLDAWDTTVVPYGPVRYWTVCTTEVCCAVIRCDVHSRYLFTSTILS